MNWVNEFHRDYEKSTSECSGTCFGEAGIAERAAHPKDCCAGIDSSQRVSVVGRPGCCCFPAADGICGQWSETHALSVSMF